MTLLQIAGGQTWPNFLPILGYRPSHVIFFTSNDDKKYYEKAINALKEAANALPEPITIDVKLVSTAGAYPTLAECRAVLQSLEPSSISLINLTGGTKAMSQAAFLFAQEHRIPSFHLDTRRTEQPFDDWETAPHPKAPPELKELSRQIDVRTALQCQAFPVPANFKQPNEAFINFSQAAAALRHEENDSNAISNALSQWRTRLHSDDGKNFLDKGRLREALAQQEYADPNTPWGRYLLAAAEAGIVSIGQNKNSFSLTSLDLNTSSTKALSSEATNHFKLLEGLWFELAVLSHLRSKPEFSDIQWSVEADRDLSPSAASKGETDLVAFNHHTLNLHFISCKTAGPHSSPLDHIQGLRARATKEGGQFAKAELWIFRPKSPNQRQELMNHCKEQKVSLHIFTEL